MKSNPVQNILESKIIACVASLHPGQTGKCLDLLTAINVIRVSGTGALVYHAPSKGIEPDDFKEYEWTFADMLRSVKNLERYDILANTSRAASAKEAIDAARAGEELFYSVRLICKHQTRPIIKLEVLNDKLNSVNSEVIIATKELIINDRFTVVPLLSPNIDDITACAKIGAPLVRVQSGNIGKRSGVIHTPDLQSIIAHSPIPIILEGGIDTIYDAKQAYGLGAAGILLNSAFRFSPNPTELALQLRKVADSFSFTSTAPLRSAVNE